MTWILPNSLTSHFAPDTAVSTWGSDESCQACERWLTRRSRSTPAASWRRGWKAGTLILPRFGVILKPSHSESFAAAWISSLGVTPASRSAPPASAEGQTIRGISGPTSQTEFDFASLASASSKTWKGTSPLDSAMSSETWSALVTQRRGEYSARLRLALRTSGSASSSWPTAAARDWKDTCGMSTVRDGNPRGRLDQLARAIFHEWRTPQAMTPNALRGQGQDPIKRAAQGHQVNLQDQMVIYGRPDPVSPSTDGSRPGSWPTPIAGDWKGQVPSEGEPRMLSGRTERQGGKLNPRWVETLMGLPVGWTMPTCPSPVTIAPTNSACSATESSPQPQP